jgi:hypothetical protein
MFEIPIKPNPIIEVVTHAATESATTAQMGGKIHKITGAFVVSLPTAVSGYFGSFFASTAAIFSLDLVTGTDVFILNGTALTAGNKVTSDGGLGAKVYVECTEAGYYRVTSILGMVVDGGA